MNELITYTNPKSPISEAYRGIRTNIQFANIDKNIKTILVTSSTPGEGKTTTLGNLAVVLAANGHKVLVVDCDMRKPRIHKAFELSNKKGLSDLLVKGDDYKAYLHEIEGSDMEVLTAGKIPGNPSELLHSKAMKSVVEQMKEDYDYILFDTPPILPVTDAAVMSSYIDGAVLVITSGEIKRDVAKKAKDALVAVNANILGVVMNKVTVEDRKSYQSYYYYQSSDDKNED